jgi:AraC-like DNA-binding protein
MHGTFPTLPKNLTAGRPLRAWTVQVLDALIAATAQGDCPVRFVVPPNKSPPPQWQHLHDQPELLIQCAGTTRFSLPETPRQIDLKAGEVLSIPRLLAHRETIVGKASGDAFANLVFMPDDRQISYHLAMRSTSDPSQPKRFASDAFVASDARLAVAAMDGLVRCGRSPQSHRAEAAGWFIAWANLMRSLLANAPIAGDVDERVVRCRLLVESYLSDPDLSVELLAQWCGCSTTHLGRIFRAESGETLAAYISRERLERACTLLSSTVLPVRTIANTVGYRDASYFCRSFRRVLSKSPDEWRRGSRSAT